MLRKATAVTGLIAVLCVGAVAAGAAAITDDDGGSTTTMRIDAQTAKPITEMPPEVVENFVLFRERPADRMSAAVRAQVGSSDKFGRNADLARKIDTVTGDGWVIPGNGFICIAVPDPVDGYGTTCSRTQDAIARGLWIRLADGGPDGKVYDTVLVPDGKKAVDEDGNELPTDFGVSSRAGQPQATTSVGD